MRDVSNVHESIGSFTTCNDKVIKWPSILPLSFLVVKEPIPFVYY